MPKFILIDHSLEKVGGHNFEYALHMLREAEAAGFTPILAANRQFKKSSGGSSGWPTYPLFRHTTYSKYALYTGGRVWNAGSDVEVTSKKWRGGWFQNVTDAWNRRGGRRILRHFTNACDQLFSDVPLGDDDHVFFPTLSEFDFIALTDHLQRNGDSLNPSWHLQFHFDLLQGREPEYDDQQDRLRAVSRLFRTALDKVPRHRLSFYATTNQVAAQYNRLRVADFRTIDYPVSNEFTPDSTRSSAGGALRVTCAGHFRKEKGRAQLAEVVRRCWSDLFSNHRMQLFVQCRPQKLRKLLPGFYRGRFQVQRPGDHSKPEEPVVCVAHPLDPNDYVKLVKESDVGLFLYDSERYYARCSGILVEMLSAGVPVIVPAGSWLASQIERPVHDHLMGLRNTLPAVESFRAGQLHWTGAPTAIPRSDGDLTFGDAWGVIDAGFPVAKLATDVMFTFRWRSDAPGAYARVEFLQIDDDGSQVDRSVSILGQDGGLRTGAALAQLHADAKHVRLSLGNAFHDAPLSIDDWEITFLDGRMQFDAGEPFYSGCPAGAVGLIAADTSQVPRLLADMCRNFSHYRKTVEEFSQPWRQKHSPRTAFATLLERANGIAATAKEAA